MANDYNHVGLIGRLTRDLGSSERDFGYTTSGVAKGVISIACNRSRKNGTEWVEEVSYFDIQIWGKTAVNLKPYLKKGKQVAIEGILKQERWQDKQTGNNRSKIVINAVSVQLLGGKSGDEEYNPNTLKQVEQEQSSFAQQYQQQEQQEQWDEDIPF